MNRVAMLSSILFFTGCFEEKDYCTEYVDYMCDCHADDPDYDCATQQAIYDDASFEQQTDQPVQNLSLLLKVSGALVFEHHPTRRKGLYYWAFGTSCIMYSVNCTT